MLGQLLAGTLELLTRSQAGEALVVSCPGVCSTEPVLVEQVSVLLGVVVVRVVMLVSLLTSWSWGQEDR